MGAAAWDGAKAERKSPSARPSAQPGLGGQLCSRHLRGFGNKASLRAQPRAMLFSEEPRAQDTVGGSAGCSVGTGAHSLRCAGPIVGGLRQEGGLLGVWLCRGGHGLPHACGDKGAAWNPHACLPPNLPTLPGPQGRAEGRQAMWTPLPGHSQRRGAHGPHQSAVCSHRNLYTHVHTLVTAAQRWR